MEKKTPNYGLRIVHHIGGKVVTPDEVTKHIESKNEAKHNFSQKQNFGNTGGRVCQI
jgi:hypothetical protein